MKKDSEISTTQQSQIYYLSEFESENLTVRIIISTYKIKECKIPSYHDLSKCMNYHNDSDRRRDPFQNGILLYKPDLCIYRGTFCRSKDSCEKSHNLFEINFHPSKFLTILCNFSKCSFFGPICPFAHSPELLRNGEKYLESVNPRQNNSRIFNNKIAELIYCLNNPDNQTHCDLDTFKIIKCNIIHKHNEKQCIFYHSTRDYKRQLNQVNYTSEMCKFSEGNRACPNGEYCPKAHNKVEQFYHKEKFKTKFCANYNNLEKCEYGNFCSFAHSEDEIKVVLIHKLEKNEYFYKYLFKTVMCPINYNHEKKNCCYAHNWQDYRRPPLEFPYKNKLCEFWDTKRIILNYNEGCPQKNQCGACHGWKELDYHPKVYKTKKCHDYENDCSKGASCAFLHKEDEKAVNDEKVQKDENSEKIQKDENSEKFDEKADKTVIGGDSKSQINQFDKDKSLNISIQNRTSNFTFDSEARLSLIFEGFQPEHSRLDIFNKIRGSEVLNDKGIINRILEKSDNQTLIETKSIENKRTSQTVKFNSHILEEEFEDENQISKDFSSKGFEKKNQTVSVGMKSTFCDSPLISPKLKKKKTSKFFKENEFNDVEEEQRLDNSTIKKKIDDYLEMNGLKELCDKIKKNEIKISDLINLNEDEIGNFAGETDLNKISGFKSLMKTLIESNDSESLKVYEFNESIEAE